MNITFSYIDGGTHPVVGRVFYWNPVASGSADASRYNRYVCGVLGAIAQTAKSCDRLLADIECVQKGAADQIETGGNDVTLTLTALGVQVDIDVNEDWVGQPEGRFTLEEWRLVLEGWRKFLEMPEGLDSILEVEI